MNHSYGESRELKSGLPLLSGWLRYQKQVTFEEFLQPIADEFRVRSLLISGIMSDKQQGLPAAIEKVFPGIPHGYCQAHYLKNIAEPISQADSNMKVSFRKQVRETVGELLRHEEAENQGVLTVTGLIPSPLEMKLGKKNASSINESIALNSSSDDETVSGDGILTTMHQSSHNDEEKLGNSLNSSARKAEIPPDNSSLSKTKSEIEIKPVPATYRKFLKLNRMLNLRQSLFLPKRLMKYLR